MNRWVCLLLLLLNSLCCQAQTLTASQALAQKRWAEAVPLLRQENPKGARNFYNLGLCYQQLNDLGRARAYYEASLALDPWSSDVHNNLALIKSKLLEPEPEANWWQTLSLLVPPAGVGTALLCCSWLTCALAWLYARSPRERWLWSGCAGMMLTFTFALLWAAQHTQPERASVLPESASLVNGPGREFSESLLLHAGNLVEIVRTQGDWVEVDAVGRVRAWIRRDEILPLANLSESQ